MSGTVVVLTPMNLEYRAMRAQLAQLHEILHPEGTSFEVGSLPGTPWQVALAVTGEGNSTTAVLAERAISSFRPEALLVVGVAGALKNDIELGDVVVATWVYSYHGGKEDADGFRARPRGWASTHRLEQAARRVENEGTWTGRLPVPASPAVHFKPIAAGEVVLNSRDTPLALQIRRNYDDAAAIEMESAGASTAAHLNASTPMITIRGISDKADGRKHLSDTAGLQPVAAAHAAAFAAALLEELATAEPAATRGFVIGDRVPVESCYQGGPASQEGAVTPAFAPAATGAEIARPGLTQAVAELVLSGRSPTVGMTTGVRGAGGFGKTTVARIVAQMDQVKQHFSDGVLWVTLGEEVQGPDLAEKANQVCWQLTGIKPPLTDPALAGVQLGRALAERRFLLIVDDVWSAAQLAPFLQGGAQTVRLVTTRQHSVLPDTAPAVEIDAMQPDEARQLLLDRLPHVTHRLVTGLLAATGRWPMLLALVNRSARDRVNRGQTAAAALQAILSRLRQQGPTVLDVKDPGQRHRAVATTVEISIGQLDAAERDRYLELAVFPEDADIPLAVLDRYWNPAGDWNSVRAEQLCERLADLSLVSDFRLDPPRLRVHDVIRSYLRHRVDGHLGGLHRRLLNRYRDLARTRNEATPWWRLADRESYLWLWAAHHLDAAGLQDELRTCLHHPEYLAGKLERLGPAALESDLSLLKDPVTSDLLTVIRQSAHLLGRLDPPGSLQATLASRLRDRPAVSQVARHLQSTLATPSLSPIAPMPDAPHAALSRILLGDAGGVLAVTVAADSSWAASATGYGAVYVWDPATGHVQHILTGHDGAILALAGSPDASLLISAGHDRTVRLWDLATGQCHHVLTGHTDEVTALTMAPDGSWLASADRGGTIRLWDLVTGQCRHVLDEHTGDVAALAVAPDGSWLVSASQDQTVRIWNPIDGGCRHVLTGHTREVTSLAVAPDGSWFASASEDRTVRIWDPADGRCRHILAGHDDRVWVLAVSPGGSWLASAGHDSTVRTWDPATGTPRHTLTGHEGSVHALVIAPDESWLASVDDGGTIRIWDSVSGGCRDILAGHTGVVMALAVEPHGSWLISGGVDATVRIWRPTPAVGQTIIGHTKWVYALTVASDRSWAASAGDDGTVRIWDPSNGECRHTLAGHTEGIRALAAAPDGSWLASAGYDATVHLWDPVAGSNLMTLTAGSHKLRTLTISPDGSWLSAAGQDGIVRLWDPASGKRLHTLRGHKAAERGFGGVLATATDSRGAWLASSGHDGTIRIWDPADGTCMHVLAGHDSAVHVLAAAPDGSWLASGSQDRSVRIWDPATGRCRHTLYGHAGGVKALAVAPDASWVASTDDTGSIRIWDPASGQCIRALHGHNRWVWALAASEDGWLASAGDDTTLNVWNPLKGECLAALRVDARLRAAVWAGNTVILGGAHGPYFIALALSA